MKNQILAVVFVLIFKKNSFVAGRRRWLKKDEGRQSPHSTNCNPWMRNDNKNDFIIFVGGKLCKISLKTQL